MAAQVMTKAKDFVDGLFPIKTFCLSLALLMLLFLLTIGIYQIFVAEPVVQPQLTGKTIALFEMPKAIVEQPIKPHVEEPPVTPVQPPIEPNANLEEHPASTLTPDEHKPAPQVEEPTASIEVEDSIAGLSETSKLGPLPIIRASDNLKSVEAYKAPFKLSADTKGVISLVMVDYGLSDKLTKAAVQTLPTMTTFIASPYAHDLQPKISGARSSGMEVWMSIPMQGNVNSQTSNMGPNAILSGLNAKENLVRLNTHLGKATGYAGVAFDVKPTFAEGSKDLQALITSISLRGLGIAQLETTDTLIAAAAGQTTAPFAHGNTWIDSILMRDDILKSLADIEKKSLADGQAIASFHPSPLIYSVIAEWQKGLSAQKIQLAPLTYAIGIAKASPQKEVSAPKEPAPKESKNAAH